MIRLFGRRRWLVALAAAIAVAAVVVACVEVGLRPVPEQQTDHLQRPAPAASTSAPVSLPNKLIIKKIGVKAKIEQVTVDADNNMAAPSKPTHVGWYQPGIVPGRPGDAVIDGHLDWHNMPHAVFFKLDRLRTGDKIDVINEDGTTLRFAVTRSQRVRATAHPAGLFATTGKPRLTLITCTGTWDADIGMYPDRLLVDADYVGKV